MTKRSTGLLGLLFCGTMLGGVAHAQEQSLPTPPAPRIPLDAHGINVVTGYYNTSVPLISIGGLGVTRQYLGLGWRESYIGTINSNDGVNYSVSVGASTEVFSKSGTFTNTEGGASTLTYNSTNQQYTYTLADGTVLLFGPPGASQYEGGPWEANAGRLSSVQHPDGQLDTYAYQQLQFCSGTPQVVNGGGAGTVSSGGEGSGAASSNGVSGPSTVAQPNATGCTNVVRLNTITSNTGYQLTLVYKDLGTELNIDHFYVSEIDGANTVAGGVGEVAMISDSATSTSINDGAVSHTYSYNSTGALVTDQTGISPSATVRTMTYNSNNQVATYNDGYYTYNYTYSLSGTTETTTVAGPTGNKVYVSNTSTNEVTSFTDELSHATSFTYDSFGRLQKQTNPENDYVVYAYDGRGNVTSTATHPKPTVGGTTLTVSASYDASCAITVKCNKPNATFDAKGFETDYVYDPTHGGVISVTQPAPSGAAPTGSGTRPQTRYSYTAYTAPSGSGTIYRLTGTSSCATTVACSGTADETKTTITYGTNLLPTTVTQAAGNGAVSTSASVTFDGSGNLYTMVGPLGAAQTTRYRYGASHQLQGVVGPDPDGSGALTYRATRLTYDGRGLVTLSEQGTVPSQSDSDWANFSSLLQLAKTYDPNGNALTTAVEQNGTIQTLAQSSYNTRGLLQCTASRDPSYASSLPRSACTVTSSTLAGADQIKQLTYDAAGHVTSNIEGAGTSDAATVATWTYGADGEKLTATDANSNQTIFSYDGFNRLTQAQFPAVQNESGCPAVCETYAYDANSNLTTLTRRGGTAVTYGYDNLNRKISASETVTTGYTNYAYGYDNFSRLISMSSTPGAGGAAQSYSFTYDQLGRKTGETSPLGTATSTWDAGSRRTRLTWPDGFYVNYGYDTDGELTSVQDSTGVTLATLAYDNLGRRTSLTRNSGVTTSYGYDNASRISSITHSLPTTSQSQTESYTYNVASQVLTKTGSNDGWAWNDGYNFNRAYASNAQNEQTTAGAYNLSWSAKGDMTNNGTNTFSYDTNNTMFQASTGSSEQYDAAGRIYSVGASGATRFLYDGDFAIAEYNSSGAVARRYVPGSAQDEPLVWYEGSGSATRYGLTSDRLGSVTGITTDAGALSAVNSYDEYGIGGTANAGRYQYTGQKWLTEIGLYDYKARIYSPTLGRFMQPDPIGYGDGINFYQYVHSDPVNGWDPSGLDAVCGIDGYPACSPPDSSGGGDSDSDDGGDIVVTGHKVPVVLVTYPPIIPPPQLPNVGVISYHGQPTAVVPAWSLTYCQGGLGISSQTGATSDGGLQVAAGNAAVEAGAPTVSKTGGVANGGISGPVTSPASGALRGMTGGARFGPLRGITGTSSVGGSIGRALPVLGALLSFLDFAVMQNATQSGGQSGCTPVA